MSRQSSLALSLSLTLTLVYIKHIRCQAFYTCQNATPSPKHTRTGFRPALFSPLCNAMLCVRSPAQQRVKRPHSLLSPSGLRAMQLPSRVARHPLHSPPYPRLKSQPSPSAPCVQCAHFSQRRCLASGDCFLGLVVVLPRLGSAWQSPERQMDGGMDGWSEDACSGLSNQTSLPQTDECGWKIAWLTGKGGGDERQHERASALRVSETAALVTINQRASRN